MDDVWDVVIVGGGPAGSAAALAARHINPDASVVVLDRHEFPRDKCCGDAVLNRAVTQLADYGVRADEVFAGYSPAHRMRITAPSGTIVERRLLEPITVIPRYVLDHRLLEVARSAGAAWRNERVTTVEDRGSVVAVNGSVHARVVIGADGAESVVRRAIVGTAHRTVAVAIRGYDGASDDPTPKVVLRPRGGLNYAWRFPSTVGPANVGYGHLLRPGEPATRSELLHAMARLLPGSRPDPATLRAHRLPLAAGHGTVGSGNVLLTGDAAGLINPLSGEGIFYAITSGLCAGASAAKGTSVVSRYRQALYKRLGTHHLHTALLAAATHIPGVFDAGTGGAVRSQRVFEDLTDIGLGEGKVTTRLALSIAGQLIADRFRSAA